MKIKICSKCQEIKLISEFYKKRINKDGLQCSCKICRSEQNKQYYQRNKKRLTITNNQRLKKWKKNNPKRYWCMTTITQHKRRGYKVLFTWKDLLPIAEQTTYCPLCIGIKLDWEYGKGLSGYSPTMDRKDNSNILTLDNTWIICHRCNRIKSDMSMQEFIDYCEMIYKKFKELGDY